MDEKSLDALYQSIIKEKSRNPHNQGTLSQPDFEQEATNPLCGDEVTLQGSLSKNPQDKLDQAKINKLVFEAQACAICQASAEIMIDTLKGKTLAEAKLQVSTTLNKLTQETQPQQDESKQDELTQEDIAALVSVRQFPARIQCATLPWEAMAKAIKKI